MKRKIATLFFIFLAIAIGSYFYIYQDFRDIEKGQPAYFISSTTLKNDFKANDSLANIKYLDKIIGIKGKVSSIDFYNRTVEIDGKILAVFKDSIQVTLVKEQELKIKGRFIGYDDLFEQYRFDQVVLEK